MKDFFKKIVLFIITFEAKIILKKNNPKIIAITGNLGKTTTKDLIYFAIKDELIDKDNNSLVLASKKSMNSDFGIPLTILGLESGWNNIFSWLKIMILGFLKIFDNNKFKYLILEVGADRPHDIENVCKYINTDIVVMTQFAKVPVHIELFGGDRDKLIREKKYLVESLKTGGTFIFNADDEDCVKIAIDIKKENDSINLKTFSFKNNEADIFVNNTEMIFNKDFKEFAKVEGIKSTLEMHSKTIHVNMIGTIGDAIIYSFMPAILVSDALNINIDKAVKNIESSKRTNGRMRILEGIYNTVLIDDSYNASPKAVEHGINTINNINTNSKKIFVLGDMLDLGDFTKSEHERIGELLVNKCDILITSGIRSKFTAKSAIQHGMNGENVYETNNSIEAGKALIGILDDIVEEEYKSGKTEKDIGGIIIFVKGSQGARMERVTKMILAKNHNPNAVLVRQEKVWEDK